MSKPIILMDMDDVLVDLTSKTTIIYNDTYKDAMSAEELFKDWDLHKRAKCGEDIYKIFKQPGFFEGLEAKDGAIDGFRLLMDYYDIKIVTSISRSAHAAYGKIVWLEKNMPFFDIKNLFMCKYKSMIYGDIMIDDSYENLHYWSKEHPHGIPVMFASHHNIHQRHEFGYNVDNWLKLVSTVLKLLKWCPLGDS